LRFFCNKQVPLDPSHLPLTLASGKENQCALITAICGGWGIRQHLNQLGIRVGAIIRVKREGAFGGPVLVIVDHSEIAIGRQMANKIQIQVINGKLDKEK